VRPGTHRESATSGAPAAGAGTRRRRRLDALASLLSDDADTVRAQVRAHLLRAGPEALPALRRAAAGEQPRIRARARGLLLEMEQREALRRLARFAVREPLDLERALFLLARFHAPGLDPRPYQRALDAFAAGVARRAAAESDPMKRALTLVEHLGGEVGMGGSVGEFHHPDNIDLHRAIERRAGMPLTLSALWLFVARRASIQAALVPLPGHVMLRLTGDRQSVIVDPYHKGRVRTEAECREYLRRHGLPARPSAFQDAQPGMMLRRQVSNLLRSARMRGLSREVRSLAALLRALEPRREPGRLPA